MGRVETPFLAAGGFTVDPFWGFWGAGLAAPPVDLDPTGARAPP